MTTSDDAAAFRRIAIGYEQMASNASALASNAAALAELVERLNRTAAGDSGTLEEIEAEFEALVAANDTILKRCGRPTLVV